MADTVRMIRREPMFEGGPTCADVHPDEVENWKECGWEVASDPLPLAAPIQTNSEPPKPGRRGRKSY